MSLKLFDTHLGAKGIEGICELRHCLTPLLVQCGPSHVLVVIISNKVILFLEGINKSHPSGSWPKNCRLILGMLLTVSLPPISDMGKGLKEHEGDFFTVGKNLDREITL
jgi:hypothetical protein